MESNKELLEQVTAKAKSWLSEGYDAETQAEVRRLLEADDKTELIESFYRDLEFGTGGLRGIMGVGTNRMNIYTVRGLPTTSAKHSKTFLRFLLLSVMTSAIIPVNSPKSLPTYSPPTASRYICSTASGPHPSSRTLSVTSHARAASI